MGAIWSGTISFGLVTIPIQLFPATQRQEISFHLLHEPDQSRIRYSKVCAEENREVPDGEIIRAFEYQKGRFVTLSDEELAAADPEMTRTIDILDFVDGSQIDPVYFVKPYYLGPQPGGEKAYTLLARALARQNKVAIGQCVIRTKQYLVAIRSVGEDLVLETMHYPGEIVEVEALRQGHGKAEVTEAELELAESLIGHMAGAFEPEKYKDTYREKVLQIVDRKVAGEAIVVPKAPPKIAPVVDLVGALKSSLAELKKAG